MDNFTPVSATIGGAMIGMAAVILMAFNGRIAGISGIFSGVLFADYGDRLWRILFIAGLIVAPVVYMIAVRRPPEFVITNAYPLIVLGGVLVGFGTRLGSGCTSGHGVCGVSRLSYRSMLSVGVFMVSGMLTVYVLKTVLGLS